MIYGEVGRLTDDAFRQSVRLAETMALLAVTVQYAWFDAWSWGYRQANAAFGEHAARQARTVRLIRRGVPPAAAAQGLRLV